MLEIVPRADANVKHDLTLKKPKATKPPRPFPAVIVVKSASMERTNQENLLTVVEAAARSGLSETALRSAMARGRLPHQAIYGRKLITPADVDTYRDTVRMGRPPKRGPDDQAAG